MLVLCFFKQFSFREKQFVVIFCKGAPRDRPTDRLKTDYLKTSLTIFVFFLAKSGFLKGESYNNITFNTSGLLLHEPKPALIFEILVSLMAF